jgi:hypothetical protein
VHSQRREARDVAPPALGLAAAVLAFLGVSFSGVEGSNAFDMPYSVRFLCSFHETITYIYSHSLVMGGNAFNMPCSVCYLCSFIDSITYLYSYRFALYNSCAFAQSVS